MLPPSWDRASAHGHNRPQLYPATLAACARAPAAAGSWARWVTAPHNGKRAQECRRSVRGCTGRSQGKQRRRDLWDVVPALCIRTAPLRDTSLRRTTPAPIRVDPRIVHHPWSGATYPCTCELKFVVLNCGVSAARNKRRILWRAFVAFFVSDLRLIETVKRGVHVA